MNSYKKLIVPGIYVLAVSIIIFCSFMFINGIKNYITEKNDYNYTLDILDDTMKVNAIDNNTNIIVKPFIDEDIDIYRKYYDYKNEQVEQEKSILFFEDTYIQNTGIDYISDNIFDIVAIYDGVVESIKDDSLYGKILTIKHNNNLISTYSGIGDVLVNVGYKVNTGEIIASSKVSNLNENKNTLHLEVIYNNEIINPETIFNHSISEFQ